MTKQIYPLMFLPRWVLLW